MVFNIVNVRLKKESPRLKKSHKTISGKMNICAFLKAYQKGDTEMSQWKNPGIGWEHS